MQPEIWDIYDVNRRRTGRTVKREAAWGFEKYHLIVHVCIFNPRGELLIQKRAARKKAWPDLWSLSVCGSALAGEDSFEAAERETKEELGIELSLKDVRPHFSVNYERGFDDFYIVTLDADINDLTLQKEEVSEVKWADAKEIKRLRDKNLFVPYFPAIIELVTQLRDNYDGSICQSGRRFD